MHSGGVSQHNTCNFLCSQHSAPLLSPRHSRTVLLSCVTQVSVGDCLTAALFIVIHQLSSISIQRVIKQKFCSHVNNNFNNIYVSEIINFLFSKIWDQSVKVACCQARFCHVPPSPCSHNTMCNLYYDKYLLQVSLQFLIRTWQHYDSWFTVIIIDMDIVVLFSFESTY